MMVKLPTLGESKKRWPRNSSEFVDGKNFGGEKIFGAR